MSLLLAANLPHVLAPDLLKDGRAGVFVNADASLDALLHCDPAAGASDETWKRVMGAASQGGRTMVLRAEAPAENTGHDDYVCVAGPMGRHIANADTGDEPAPPATPGGAPAKALLVASRLVATSGEAADALTRMPNTYPVARLGYGPEAGVVTWGLYRSAATPREFVWLHVSHAAPGSDAPPVLVPPPFFLGMAATDEAFARVLDASDGASHPSATGKLAGGALPCGWQP